tara:strand:+ start:168 stop:632 length:465 start_codon:yes stop_codon:yes gene_type:complete
MTISELLVITGISGLHLMEAKRENGLIVCGLSGDKKRFASSRKHMFTPLDNITIYTDQEGLPIVDVFRRMRDSSTAIPAGGDGKALRDYFTEIVPEHDAERVYSSDIKKVLLWFTQLKDADLLHLLDEDQEEVSSTDLEETQSKEDIKSSKEKE